MVEISPNAIDLIEKMNREADFFGRPDNVYSEICAQHGLSLGMIGKLKEGEVYCEKSVQFAAELGDLRTLGCNEWLCGMFYHLKGSWKRAVERLESAIRHSEEANWLLVLGLAYTAIGSSYAWLEEPKLALDYIEKGITIKNEAGIKVIASFQYWMTSETYFQVGEPAKALKFAEMALTSSKQNGERQLEGISWILRGMLTGYNNLSNTDKAEEYLKKGLKILNALSIKPYHAIGYFYIGEFYFKTDQKGKASETLRNAEKMFKEMGMNFWLTKTTQVLDSLQ
jgi:tetratricopeptide (TPR) repeat protein